jgi:hypothetical protein
LFVRKEKIIPHPSPWQGRTAPKTQSAPTREADTRYLTS